MHFARCAILKTSFLGIAHLGDLPYLCTAIRKRIRMRTRTTTTPVELKVLMNHIYELHKGVRHMVLFTCNKKYSEQTIQRHLRGWHGRIVQRH